jgi:hypothetical protein
VPLGEPPADGAHEQVRRREDRPRERHKGSERGERDDHESDQGEARHEREDDHHPEKDDAGQPFDSILHGSTTFLVRGGLVRGEGPAAGVRSHRLGRQPRWPVARR